MTFNRFFTVLAVMTCLVVCGGWSFFPFAAQPVPKSIEMMPPFITQVVQVQRAGTDIFKARLTGWQKRNGRWRKTLPDMQAVIGRNGIAPVGEKREGDGRTPSGIYRLGTAFGYPRIIRTKLAYRQVTDNDAWVDDPASPQYNQWVQGLPNAKSFERLKRDDDLYKYAIVIEYNTVPVVPGHGSAIFLHVWRAQDRPTSGCVAVSEKNMLRLLNWLAASANPAIILEDPGLQ